MIPDLGVMLGAQHCLRRALQMFRKIIKNKKEGHYFKYRGHWMSVMFLRDIDYICGCDIDIYINGIKFIFTTTFNGEHTNWEETLQTQLDKKINLLEKKFFAIEDL